MTPDPSLLIIGGKLKIVEKARALGLRVFYAQVKEQYGAEHKPLVDGVVLADYTDWSVLQPLALGAHQAWGFTAAVSLTEPGLDVAGRVNDLLGLGGTSFEVSHRFTDKWQMRTRLAATGQPAVAAAVIEDRDALAAFADAHGYPFIVKPTSVTASFGVFAVRAPADLGLAWDNILRLRAGGANQWARFFKVDEFMAEEFIEGPEYSVESFSFAGRHMVIAVTEKASIAENFVELGHAMPAPLDPDSEAAIVAATEAFLDAMELKDGPAHTEIKLSARGPRIIESHNRVGGDRINELVHAAYGIDMDTYTLGWPFRLVDELPDRPVPKRAAATRFLLGTPGVVTDVQGAEAVRADPAVVALDVNVAPGDQVMALRGNWDRIGQVVATGEDTEAAIATCEQLLGKINVITAPAEA